MSTSRNKDFNKNTSSSISPDITSQSSENHSYVNLDETHTGERLSSNASLNMNRRSGTNAHIQPLTIYNVNKLTPSNSDYNGPNKNSNDQVPKNWYSPPNSVISDSKQPSFVGTKQHTRRDLPKLNTIDEDSLMLSIDKVIALCTNDNKEIQLNALCYLQHLIFNNNHRKLEVRNANGLRPIIELTRLSKIPISNAALGVLKNMSFTEMDMITSDIERLGGIQRMVSIIKDDKDILQKELAIDILWNLSVHYDLKNYVLTETVDTLLQYVIIPESQLVKEKAGNYIPLSEDVNWSIILRNALGIIRNISYESTEARIKLRKADGLIDCLLHLIFMSNKVQETDGNTEQITLIDSKIVENCVCILRNLTYAIQEVVDPNYVELHINQSPKPSKQFKGKNNSTKKPVLSPPVSKNPKGVELLWNSKYVVAALFPILKYGANVVTLEAAAGIIQNQSAGDWEPSKELQIQFRFQLALPTLVELIDIAPDEVIRSAATALRNLVREENTRMLIGANGLRILTEKIPYHSRSKKISIVALAAILSTIYAIIKSQEEFMKEFISAKGAERCIHVRDSDEFINNDDQHPDKVKQFCKFILQILWKTPAARDLLKQNNYKQSDITQSHSILDPCNLCAPSKPSKPKQNNEDLNSRDSTDLKNNNEFSSKYPEDSKFVRDSISTMISNAALQQRNSVAHKTTNIPGYGLVKVSANYEPNNKNHANPLPNNKPNFDDRGQRSNHINTYISNEYHSNPKNYETIAQYKSKRDGSEYSYSNKSYSQHPTDTLGVAQNNKLGNGNIRNRPQPHLPYQKGLEINDHSETYSQDYSKPIKPYKTSNSKDKEPKGDSWV